MTYYERNLPHWHPEGRILFVTWRLCGSLPEHVVTRLRNTKEPAGRQFARAEKFLDKGSFGPLWLRSPRIANCVQLSILRGARELDQYALLAYVVMPNHVHFLIQPRVPLERITGGIKGGKRARRQSHPPANRPALSGKENPSTIGYEPQSNAKGSAATSKTIR